MLSWRFAVSAHLSFIIQRSAFRVIIPMSTPIEFIPAKPRVRRTRRDAAGPASPGLTITSVQLQVVPRQLIVRFSAPIVWNGVDVPLEFKAYTSDEFFDSPFAVVSVGADWMELEFNGAIAVGAAWEVVGAMAGITPVVAFPQ